MKSPPIDLPSVGEVYLVRPRLDVLRPQQLTVPRLEVKAENG